MKINRYSGCDLPILPINKNKELTKYPCPFLRNESAINREFSLIRVFYTMLATYHGKLYVVVQILGGTTLSWEVSGFRIHDGPEHSGCMVDQVPCWAIPSYGNCLNVGSRKDY